MTGMKFTYAVDLDRKLVDLVRKAQVEYPGAEIYYRDSGTEALLLTGDLIITIREDGAISTAIHDEWFTVYWRPGQATLRSAVDQAKAGGDDVVVTVRRHPAPALNLPLLGDNG